MANNKIFFTDEQKADIASMYTKGMPIKDIQDRHRIHSPSTVYTVLKDMGIEKGRAVVPTHKSCICGNKKNTLEARYCFVCGRLLLSDEEIAVDKLLSARAKFLRFVPDAQRDEFDKTYMEAINFIKIKLNIK